MFLVSVCDPESRAIKTENKASCSLSDSVLIFTLNKLLLLCVK